MEEEMSIAQALQFIHKQHVTSVQKENSWRSEREELLDRVAFLEGQLQGHEMVKENLLKRIAMLELALKSGQKGENTSTISSERIAVSDKENVQVKPTVTKAKELMKKYLTEIGIDESSELKSVKFSQDNMNFALKSFESQERRTVDVKQRQKVSDSIIYEPSTDDSPIISNLSAIDELDSPLSSAEIPPYDENESSSSKVSHFNSGTIQRIGTKQTPNEQQPNYSDPSVSSIDDSFSKSSQKYSSWKKKKKSPYNTTTINTASMGEMSGELSDLSIDDISTEVSDKPTVDLKKDTAKMWKPKHTLKSHFDSVRSGVFHPNEQKIFSGSEDGTIKYWNFELYNKKNVDVEPLLTLRGHLGSVNALAFSTFLMEDIAVESCGTLVSGGYDGTLKVWNIPKNVVAYSKYEPKSLMLASIDNESDIIWDVKFHPVRNIVACLTADNLKIYSLDGSLIEKKPIQVIDKFDSVATSFDFVKTDHSKLVISFANGKVGVYDFEKGSLIFYFEDDLNEESKDGDQFINKIVSHPNNSTFITAHENKTVKFYDISTKSITSSMIAHLESVSGLDISPDGKIMITAGHDSSVRLWDIETKSCLQEFSSHRKKYDESIFFALFHPQKSGEDGVYGGSQCLATGGADSCVKLYGY